MRSTANTARQGMTLIELLVVVVILGLLGVATLPTINSSGPKRRLRDAATAVESHVNQAVARAVGSRSGAGAWVQADDISSLTSPATTLSFCAGSTESAGTATLTLTSATAATCSVTLSPPFAVLTGTTSYLKGSPPSGCLIRFAGFPYEYTFSSPDALTFSGSATTGSMIWPSASDGTYTGARSSLPFTLSIPPGKTTAGKTLLSGNTCVDLPSSSIGVLGYSSTIESPSNASPVILTFDSLGRVKSVVYTKAGASVVQQRRLDSRTPVAFLVGLRDQVGLSAVSSPSEDNPGANWQRSDAWWVVVDPRTSTTFRVENYPNAANPTVAQRFIRQALLNDTSAQ